jgi:type I restriction enzyme M protein
VSEDQRRAVGRRLAALRKERNIAQRALAQALDVDPSMISRVEKGERELSPSQLFAAADILGVLPEELLGDQAAEAHRGPARHESHPDEFSHVVWMIANEVRKLGGGTEVVVAVLAVAFIKLASDVGSTATQQWHVDDDRAHRTLDVPADAQWDRLIAAPAGPMLTEHVVGAFSALEAANPVLFGTRSVVDRFERVVPPHWLQRIMDLVARLDFVEPDDAEDDSAGRRFEALIDALASSQGARGGEYWTPPALSTLLARLAGPGRQVFDPACGVAGSLVRTGEIARRAGVDAELLGQELNHTSAAMARLNLAAHGFSGQIHTGNSLVEDAFPDLRADAVVANPPFKQSGWGAARVANDVRWTYATPTDRDAISAWVQHVIHHVAPAGRAAMLLPAGALFSQAPDQQQLRAGLVRDGLLAAVIALPARLFSFTAIETCIWLIDRDHPRDDILFVNASGSGERGPRGRVVLTPSAIDEITTVVDTWRDGPANAYEDLPGFCAAVPRDRVEERGFNLSPAAYTGRPGPTVSGEPAQERLRRLADALQRDFADQRRLQDAVNEVIAAVEQ